MAEPKPVAITDIDQRRVAFHRLDSAGIKIALARDGAALPPTDYTSLLAEVRGNPACTAKLTLTARTYLQGGNAENRKWTKFADGKLNRIAKSFTGVPFLRDHASYDLMSRGGTVLSSKLVDAAGEGGKAFEMDIELVKPWAVEAALDGTLDRFSISWAPIGTAKCTICSVPADSFWGYSWMNCDHELGGTYPVKYKGDVVCMLEYEDAEGTEVSGVSVPAVLGTEIEGIRAALAAATGGGKPVRPKETTTMLNKTIAAKLGLAEDAGDEAIVAKLDGELAALTATRTALDAAKARVAELEGAAKTAAKAQLALDTDVLIASALSSGKLRPELDKDGKPVVTPIESAIRGMVDQLGMEAAKKYVDSLPAVIPVGAGSRALASRGASDPKAPAASQLSATELSICKQTGVTPEAFLETKNKAAIEQPEARR